MNVAKIVVNTTKNVMGLCESIDSWKIIKTMKYEHKNYLANNVKNLLGLKDEPKYENIHLLAYATDIDIYSIWYE